MDFQKEQLYHIYNRGNNSEKIFFNNRNYIYFQEKLQHHFNSLTDILAYCLMPNHFHLLTYIRQDIDTFKLNDSIAILLRSFARAINLQENRTGSLFQQKTKAKNVTQFGFVCLNYIHQNPLRSGIIKKLEDWKFSSFNEYTGKSDLKLCNVELARKILLLPDEEGFYKLSYSTINEELIQKLY